MKTLLLFSLIFILSSCAMKSVQQECSEEMFSGTWSSFDSCMNYKAEQRDRAARSLQAYGQSLQSTSQQRRLDNQCMQDCADANYQRSYCESRCSY